MTAITITDLNNAKRDVDHIAELATSVALTATDRLGNVKRTISGALAEYPNAFANAASAAANASAATTQAGISTTQAGLATAAKVAAEAARDIAKFSVGIKASIAAGLAATTTGQYFFVEGNPLLLYKNNAGAALAVPYASGLAKETAKGYAQTAVLEQFGVRNLFDPAARLVDSLLGNALVSPYGSGFVTNFIPVVEGGTLTFNKTGGFSAPYGTHFYDANKLLVLPQAASPTANTPITIPAGIAYVRATFPNAALTEMMAVQGAVLPASYLKFGLELPDEIYLQTIRAARGYTRRGINLYEPATVTQGYLIGNTTPALTASSNFFLTGYTPVTPGGQITMGTAAVGLTGNPYGGAFFDRFLNYISGFSAWAHGAVIAVPAKAAFMRVCQYYTQQENFQILEGSVVPGLSYSSQPAMLADSRHWAGKKWLAQGDSITAASPGWIAGVAAHHKATLVNHAVGGRGMSSALLTSAGAALTAADFADVDLVVLFMGTNEVGIPTGSITDSTSAATFYGYTKKFIETVLGWKPTLRIVITTLLPRLDPALTVSVKARSECLREIATFYGCPVFDVEKICGLNSLNSATYMTDSIHPNAAGSLAFLGNPAKGFFNTVFPTS